MLTGEGAPETLTFRRRIAFVKFLGSHADYDKIDALSVTLF
ncbi:MAG: type II toxin-antitoxin system HigB family toxin [Sphingomonas bacterium]|nr:type II toxin-antitoxin system HigB family toxin [Sphingomonas bacterium]